MQQSVGPKVSLYWQGLQTKWYLLAFIIILIASYLGKLPGGWLGAWTYATVVGMFLGQIGDNTPIIKDYFGGGPIVILFGGSLLVHFNLIPAQTITVMKQFVTPMDIYSFIVIALICGSLLTMNRRLLIRAGALYTFPVLGGLLLSVALAGLVGGLFGFGLKQAMYMIALPIMGGGTAAGAVPISQIYGAATQQDAGAFIAMIMPAVGLGNGLAIICAGLMDKIGKLKPTWSGSGELMPGIADEKKGEQAPLDVLMMGSGFLVCGVFLALGTICTTFVPLHYYALTIIIVALAKICNLVPEGIIEPCRQWYSFIVKHGVPPVLMAVAMVHMDMQIVLDSLSAQYFLICVVTVIGAALGAAVIGKLVGFNPIESGITAGLCMANMGGSGDLATLAAGKRMGLMQFAQISSRLGGAMILVIVSIAVKIFGM